MQRSICSVRRTRVRRKRREMVLNSRLVVKVADISANLCQYIACNPERLSSDTVLHILFCVPLQQLRRLGLSLWTYLFFTPFPSAADGGDDDYDDDSNHSHSDWIPLRPTCTTGLMNVSMYFRFLFLLIILSLFLDKSNSTILCQR